MMAAVPSKLPKLKDSKKTKEPPVRAATKETPNKKKAATAKVKPRVCLDLDGVLASYDGWGGIDKIGQPLPGAVEFARDLAKIADIVIFTSRCSTEPGPQGATSSLTPGQARIHIIDWLEKNEIPFADVFMGEGKPRVAAFIDDRAVACKPQENADAFKETIDALKEMLRKKNSKLKK
jgi:hypothetical protein